MANLFTAVSAEQQEIVAGGAADKFTLDDLIETSYAAEFLDFVTDLTSGSQGSTVGQSLGRNITTTDAMKDFTLDTK